MTEGVKIDSIPDLIKRVRGELEKKDKEAEAKTKELKQELTELRKKEKELKDKIEKAKKTVEKMEGDIEKLEEKETKEQKKAIEKDSLLAKDVKSGKASLREFQRKGRSTAEVQKEIIEKTQEELKKTRGIIREKNFEIMEDEKELLEIQHKVRAYILRPGVILKKELEQLIDFTNREMDLFYLDLSSTRTELEKKKRELLLTEGKSLTPGYRWHRMPVPEARKIQFNPILPESLVPSLLQQLSKFSEDDIVVVRLNLRPLAVDVSSHGSHRVDSDKIKIME